MLLQPSYRFDAKDPGYTNYNLSESVSIIDFAVTMKENMVLYYQDFTYAINDPYYRKEMREMSIESLLMVTFAEETEKITGVAFFYFSEKLYPEDDIIAQINPKSLRKLKDTLIQDEIEALHSEIVKQVYADTALPWVIMSDQRVYLSTPMAKVLGRKRPIFIRMGRTAENKRKTESDEKNGTFP